MLSKSDFDSSDFSNIDESSVQSKPILFAGKASNLTKDSSNNEAKTKVYVKILDTNILKIKPSNPSQFTQFKKCISLLMINLHIIIIH